MLQMCLVLGLAVLLDICLVEAKPEPEPQPEPQVQNCAFSNCNQNNFGRRRRQILEEILAEVEADEDAKVVKRQVQNCVGSACNQNNFGRKKREIAEAINALTTDVLEAEDDAVEDVEEPKSKRDADPQSQNCFGSSCNQNNFGRRKREVIAALLEELM